MVASFLDLTRVSNDAVNDIIAVDPESPLIGTGNCLIERQGAAATGRAITYFNTTPFPHGVINGKIAGLFRLVANAGSGRTIRVGFGCCYSQNDLVAGGSAYFGYLHRTSIGGDKWQVEIMKTTNGIENQSSLALSVSTSLWADDTLKAFEFQWEFISASQMDLTIRLGDATDFSDLAVALQHSDTSSPLITSVNEGIAFRSTQATFQMKLDKMRFARV